MIQTRLLCHSQPEQSLRDQKNACFICSSVDHRQAQCPLKAENSGANRPTLRRKNDKTAGLIKISDSRKKKLSKFEFPVQIQNNELIGYRDTGSPRTFVQSSLFPNVEISGQMKIWGINDVEPVTVPTCVLEIRSDYFHPRKVITVETGLLPHMVWDCLLGNDLFDGIAVNDVIGNTDGSVAADASCAKAEIRDLCLTDTDDSNPDARRDDVCASAQRPVAPSEVISREPRGQATYRSRSISSDGSLQRDSARPHGEGGLTGLTDRQTAASLNSDVTPRQVAMSRPSEIEMCQTQITRGH